MKGLANYTLKSLISNKVRTSVTIVGVALATALVAAVFTTFTSLAHFLYQTETNSSGSWMAVAKVTNEQELNEGMARAADDPHVSATAVLHEVGYGQLTEEQQYVLGSTQPIVSGEGDLGGLLGLHPVEGRMPEQSDELCLFLTWKSHEGVQLGDQLTIPVGQLHAASSDEDDPTFSDVCEHTYTVVGFYDKVSYSLFDSYGTLAFTAADQTAIGPARAFLSFTDVERADDVERLAQELFPEASISLHDALLRYMGLPSDTSMWTTFYGLICVLAAVILLACISLIFNAFNISVAERMDQFGLLSSIGATKGQLRRAVLLEATVVALIGIPLGLLLGLGGCWITFTALGSFIANLAGAEGISFEVFPDGRMLVLTTVLTLGCVLVSAWVPAKRASRMNIIDSIRSAATSRISKRGTQRANEATDIARLWSKGNGRGRIFGMGATLARMNRKRSKSTGRTASISLALAIVLLMAAGSLNVFLGNLLDAVSNGEPAGEVSVGAQLSSQNEPSGESLSVEQLVSDRNSAMAEAEAIFQDAYSNLSAAPDAIPQGWRLTGEVSVEVPANMAGAAFQIEDNALYRKTPSGSFAATAHICYASDDEFNAYATDLGLDPATFYETDAIRAIGVAQAYGNDGSTYQLLEMLHQTGTVQALVAGVFDQEIPVRFDVGTIASEVDDAGFVPYLEWSGTNAHAGDVLSMDDVQVATAPIEVTALADEPPAIAGSYGEGISLIVPLSLAKHVCLIDDQPFFRSYFNPADGDHAALAQELNDQGHAYFGEVEKQRGLSFISYNDYRAEANSNQMLATIVNVFCLLFTGILALIAMANVFNTVTNSLILRKREFAVMRSVGMSNRQFRHMIADECMTFGIAGLIPGLVISVGVSFLVWLMVSQSLSAVPFTLPWSYMGIAVGMTALAMGISVLYGMHRCKTDNVVEALRAS